MKITHYCLFLLIFVASVAFAASPDAEILTPKPADAPRFTGPKVFGVRPGSPFLFTVTATGKEGMQFSAKGLPEGLKLDPANGRITGVLKEKGEYPVQLQAGNSAGKVERTLRIVVGDKIALTPPMGWNSWNCWGDAVTQEKVLSSARALVAKGLINHGWSYVNVDDAWQGKRGGPFNAIQPNAKFPDMKALADEIHGMGLRFGVYSTPWKGSYDGHIGSSCDNADGTYDWIESGSCTEFLKYKVEKEHYGFGKIPFIDQDSKQWAAWGVDYLKYDWDPIDPAHTEAMSKALAASGRDVVYSLSNNASINVAADCARLSNCWRTTGDINDSWGSMSGIGFNQDQWAPFTGPGHWPDPDMLVVGQVGWGPTLHPSKLTPSEQYTHISLWCLMSAPLLIGCDLAQLDDFTLGLLTNDEVLDIDQDSLGHHANCVVKQENARVYVKELEDGSRAVGLFNLSSEEAKVTAPWKDLGIAGKKAVRDLWRQKDLGTFEGQFEATVPAHGVVLVRIGR
jgi:alpha-galactosidase